MHVVIVNQYGLPKGAPGITRHGDLGAELVRKGHQVTVIASRFNYLTRTQRSSAIGNDETHSGVRFRWLDTGGYRGNDRRRLRSMLAFTARSILAGWRLTPHPDVVIASSPHLLTVISGLVLSRRHRVPLVLEVRDLWPSALVDLGGIRAGGLTHRALEFLERFGYRVADRIVIVPPHADRRVAELGTSPSRCVHIPNAASIDPESAASVPGSLATIFDAAAGHDVLLYAGAQGVSNGLDVVVSALDVLRATSPSVYDRLAVILVGDGGEHAHLVALADASAHPRLWFHPAIDKDLVPDALRRATLLLVAFADAPVYEYGLSPNKLFDYLAMGRPVILATRLDDDPVTVNGVGRTYEPGSGASLAEAIEDLLGRSPEERASMGERGRRLVASQYSIGATGAQLERLLCGVIGPPS
jgi:glycosyltransferase involved in cell wall biosynthesis